MVNHMQKNEIRPLSYTTRKNYLKIDEVLPYKKETIKLLEKNTKEKSSLTMALAKIL